MAIGTPVNYATEYSNALESAEGYLLTSSFSKEGLRDQLKFEKYSDNAIKYALENALENDVIILAGKGHETYQVLNTGTIHFDEREVIMGGMIATKNIKTTK